METKHLALLALPLILVVLILYIIMSAPPKNPTIAPIPTSEPSSKTNEVSITKTPPPTRSPEEIKIITDLKTYSVIISNSSFSPSDLKVKIHDQIVWVNKDTVDHTVTGVSWGGLTLKPGGRYLKSFDQPGVYPYSCTIHPSMTGKITVL